MSSLYNIDYYLYFGNIYGSIQRLDDYLNIKFYMVDP